MPDVTGRVINKTGCKAGTTAKYIRPFAFVQALHPVLFIE